MTTLADDVAAGREHCDPVGLAEIADRLSMKRSTLDMIRYRGGENALPAPRWGVGGWPAWEWQLDIVPWALRTGRWPEGKTVPELDADRCQGCEPSGLEEIAYRLRIKRDTLDHLQHRGGDGALPDARWTVGGRPAWDFHADVEPWARRTGRWPSRGGPLRPKPVAKPKAAPGRRGTGARGRPTRTTRAG